uniref:Myosin motor domain-containing protein n=1 Tax=Oncorhynchus kisutch TaxID=8019 RepID=A0A8C7EZU6_ONCKI
SCMCTCITYVFACMCAPQDMLYSAAYLSTVYSSAVYALADNVYHTMLTETNNHFILISVESGAGKTEACKKILQFYPVSCPSTKLLDNVQDRLLLSNPVLKVNTIKNDNSSHFGKYIDIQFDHVVTVGGHILSYLLEKSRVVHENHGERNFHIFYQLVEGGEEDLLCWLGLEELSALQLPGTGGKRYLINATATWYRWER